MKHNMIRSITLAALIMALPFTIGATSTAPVFHNNKKMVTYFGLFLRILHNPYR